MRSLLGEVYFLYIGCTGHGGRMIRMWTAVGYCSNKRVDIAVIKERGDEATYVNTQFAIVQ